MFGLSCVRLAISRACVESYVEYLQGSEQELPALGELLPKKGAPRKEIAAFHSSLSEVMKENGYDLVGMKVLAPASDGLKVFRATEALLCPIFSNSLSSSNFGIKQKRLQHIESGVALKIGASPTSALTAETAIKWCSTFAPFIEVTGTRFPFFAPHAAAFCSDLGGAVGICIGKENKIQCSSEELNNHGFVLTKDSEPIQVAFGRNCLSNLFAAVTLAVSYSNLMNNPLNVGHYVFCSGLSTRSPVSPGKFRLNGGIYGEAACVLQ